MSANPNPGSLSWGDIYSGQELPAPTLDPTAAALLELIPEERRTMAEAMLAPMFLAIKASVSPEEYEAFCGDMREAVDAHNGDDPVKAEAILARYGLEYQLFLGHVRESLSQP